MSDNPTRDRISFTVDLNEVPERISCLMEEAQEALEFLIGPLAAEVKDLYDNNNAAAAFDVVTETRLKLMNVDLRLEDCQSLLANYQATQLELALQERKDEKEMPETIEQE